MFRVAGVFAAGLCLAVVAVAQQGGVLASLPASVSQTIGADCAITITYHRPGVKGRDIWHDKSDNEIIGRLVPHDEDPRPWRAGANNATTIEFSKDVTIEGEDLAAGTYALFMVPREESDWTIIFSSKPKQWGTFAYKKEEDALRVDVTPLEADHQEWLVYGFEDLDGTAATAYLHWEKKKIPFTVAVAE